jgi:hypothetical protein
MSGVPAACLRQLRNADPSFMLVTPTEFRPVGKPDNYQWMDPRACFRNAFIICTSSETLRYGEGYALVPLSHERVWVHHAWVVDVKDNAIDLTWQETGLRYVGIVVSPQELRVRQLHKVKNHLVDPVLATSIPLLADSADADWRLASWFTGEENCSDLVAEMMG